MKLRQWLENTSTQLSDFDPDNATQQFVHWSQELLLSYYNDASCYIASIKPQDYITNKIMRLAPGISQNACCAVVGTVPEHVTADGKFISSIHSRTKPPTWTGQTACFTTPYRPLSIYRLDAAPSSFEVSPPVPETGAYFVKLRCSGPPDELALANLDEEIPRCKYSSAITEWALFRALSGDTETAMLPAAQVHYKAFNDLLGLQNKMEAAFLKDPA